MTDRDRRDDAWRELRDAASIPFALIAPGHRALVDQAFASVRDQMHARGIDDDVGRLAFLTGYAIGAARAEAAGTLFAHPVVVLMIDEWAPR